VPPPPSPSPPTVTVFPPPPPIASGPAVLDEAFTNSALFTVTNTNGVSQPFFSDGYYDYFGLYNGPGTSTFSGNAGSTAAGTDAMPLGVPAHTGFTPPFLVACDLDGEGHQEPFTLTWSPVDISTCTALSFSGKFAEKPGSHIDATDFVKVQVKIDGGAAQDVLAFHGNGDGSNEKFAVDSDFNGFGDGIMLTLATQTFRAPISGTGSSLVLMVSVKVDAGSEDIAMDDLQVLCSGGASLPSPSPPAPSSTTQQSCVCGSDPTKYSTYNDAQNCFGANDLTNLNVMFAGLTLAAEVKAFYTRCSDYDNDGEFRANDLTNMAQYYAGLLSLAAHVSGRRS